MVLDNFVSTYKRERIEISGIDPHVCSQLAFNKGAKWDRNVFSKVAPGVPRKIKCLEMESRTVGCGGRGGGTGQSRTEGHRGSVWGDGQWGWSHGSANAEPHTYKWPRG